MHIPNINDLYKKHMADIKLINEEKTLAMRKYDDRLKREQEAVEMIEITLAIKFCRSCDATGRDEYDTCPQCKGYGFINQSFGR